MKITDITSPEFLKKLTPQELETLSTDIRAFIIDNVSQTGGHLSSNLGVVELTVALHHVFSSPYDKFIFDVGHQTYTHKILTGRASLFSTLRQKNGLAGFLKYDESIHDVWEAGHSSTSISAASGFLEAKEAGVDMGEVIVVIGDGALPNGLSLSGLNYLGSQKNQKAIIIVNDNDMSISPNVGRLAKHMSRIRIKKTYSLLKRITPKFIHRWFHSIKVGAQSYVYGNNVFSSLGYKYYGPIDGHNIKELIRYFEFAKQAKQSVILHVKTIKGKGYAFAENDDTGLWHGVGPFDITTGNSKSKSNGYEIPWGAGITKILIELTKNSTKMRVITPAMIGGSHLTEFQERFPQYLIDVGIAEEHAVVMAAGLSRFGLIPVVSIYATFLQRAYDQINHDVCRNNNHVIFLIDRAGINGGGDGSTHQGTFDVALLSHLPNMIITMPRNLQEAYELMLFAINYQGPIALRYPKGNISFSAINPPQNITLGSWVEVLPIQETNIITYGPDINAFEKKLKEKNVGLINARFIKPIDIEMLLRLKGKRVMIVEEVVLGGSLSAAILKTSHQLQCLIHCEVYTIKDTFIDSGKTDELKKELGIDVDSIIQKI